MQKATSPRRGTTPRVGRLKSKGFRGKRCGAAPNRGDARVVGDHNQAGPGGSDRRGQDPHNLDAGGLVEGTGRLIGQNDDRAAPVSNM